MFEAERHWSIIDAHLAANKFMLGDKYTFVDMALWGWTRAVPYFFGPEGFAKFPHLKKWFDGVNARPARRPAYGGLPPCRAGRGGSCS